MSNVMNKAGWVLAALVSITALTAMSGLVRGGPLDPPGTPAPTGKTLEEIPGSWSRNLPANDGAVGPSPPAGCNSTRFQCVLNNNAVLDRETGLVWTRSAVATFATDSWGLQPGVCLGYNTYPTGVRGWRLPTAEEMLSLTDPATSAPALPVGHPFIDLQTEYWTATTYAADPTKAYTVILASGQHVERDKTLFFHEWCVRGPGGAGWN